MASFTRDINLNHSLSPLGMDHFKSYLNGLGSGFGELGWRRGDRGEGKGGRVYREVGKGDRRVGGATEGKGR